MPTTLADRILNGGVVDVYHMFSNVGTHETRMEITTQLRKKSPSAEFMHYLDDLEELEAYEMTDNQFGRLFVEERLVVGKIWGKPYKFRYMKIAKPLKGEST